MRDQHNSPVRERWEREYDNSKENSIDEQRDLSKHRMKERSRSNRSRENEGRDSGIERTARREGDRDDWGKNRSKDKTRRVRDRDSDNYKDKEQEFKDRKGRVRVTVDCDGGKEVEKYTERSREKGRGRGEKRDRDIKDKDGGNGSHHEDETSSTKHQKYEGISSESHPARDLALRISRKREERLQKSEGDAEILTWVSKSRKIGEKGMSEKAIKFSRSLEEQDDINQGGRGDDEAFAQHNAGVLGGVKILHGLDKVIDGGAVVLTLKDQSILADGDVNQEIDMLENVEIGEQNRRDEAYVAAKKKNDVYDDKFNNELSTEKRMLPQYDDAVEEEGLTLDASGGFSGDAENKLDDLRKRINSTSTNNHFEDLNSLVTITSDYYTHEEMLQFKKPRKRKSLRKKEKLDIIDALEADAISTGLGTGDLGSRKEGKSQAMKTEQEKSDAEMRCNAYKTAYAKAEEASKALRLEQTLTMITEDHDNLVFDDDDDDLCRSLEKARKLALKNRDEAVTSGPKAVAFLASLTANTSTADDLNLPPGEVHENKLVFTEMEEFV